MNTLSRSIKITPRDEHFHFEAVGDADWHGGHMEKTFVFNAFSMMFPAGERFFIDSVRDVRDRVDDPELMEQVKAFITQEALHTREHVVYNAQLDAQGYEATRLHKKLQSRFEDVKARVSKEHALAITCGLEHFTATLAEVVITDPKMLEGAAKPYTRAWLWHAMEETEHKGVCFDVFQHVTGGKAYWTRAAGMWDATMLLFETFMRNAHTMMKARGKAGSIGSWMKLYWFLVGKPGPLRRILPQWLGYYMPGFHPWHRDNRQLIDEAEARVLHGSAGAD